MHFRTFSRKMSLIIFSILVMYFINNEAGSKLNTKGFSFGNGSGLVTVAPATDGTPRIQALTPLMTPSGLIIDENIPTESLTFLATTNMVTKLKARMLGAISAFGYIPPTSSGWLVCDGTAYSRTTYANLFSKIKTVYGNTNGTDFKVPDLRGLFIVGTLEGRIDVASKNTTTTLKSHTHDFDGTLSVATGGGNHTHTYHKNGTWGFQMENDTDGSSIGTSYFYPDSLTTTTLTTNADSSGGPSHSHTFNFTPTATNTNVNDREVSTENRPFNAAVIYCIYANP